MTIPSKMQAACCTAYGDPGVLQLKSLDVPQISSKQLLIRVYASSVNSGDVIVRALGGHQLQRLGIRLFLGWSRPRRSVLGVCYAGVVVAAGEQTSQFKVGDRVFGLTGFRFGCHAEYVAVNEKSCLSTLPAGASYEEAAAMLFGGQTAHYFLKKAGVLQNSELNILIYGASGAVGTAAVQMAKAYGHRVTAVCSDYNAPLVAALGADDLLFYNRPDWQLIKTRFEVVFDAVGKFSRQLAAPLLKQQGKYFSVASLDYASEKTEQLHFIQKLFEKGQLKACIDKSYRLDEIADAHRYVETGRKKGNVVLRMI